VKLTFERVEQLLADFTYKPNIAVAVVPSEQRWEIGTVKLLAYCPDSTRTQHTQVECHSSYDDHRYIDLRRVFVDHRYWTQKLHLTEVYSARSIPAGLEENDFRPWLRSFIRSFEDHEMDEFFKFGGKCVYNPHAEGYEQLIKEVERHADYVEQRRKAGVLTPGEGRALGAPIVDHIRKSLA
jgi:hypothetical protein